MMNEMTRTKPEPTLLPIQGIFNFPHHIGMVWEELAFDDTVKLYGVGKWIAAWLNIIAVTPFIMSSFIINKQLSIIRNVLVIIWKVCSLGFHITI